MEKQLQNEETEPRQKEHPIVDVTGDGSKVRHCKEQYCIGTWNVRSMNQGKLDVVKQDMAPLGFSRQEHWSGLPFPSPVHESEK